MTEEELKIAEEELRAEALEADRKALAELQADFAAHGWTLEVTQDGFFLNIPGVEKSQRIAGLEGAYAWRESLLNTVANERLNQMSLGEGFQGYPDVLDPTDIPPADWAGDWSELPIDWASLLPGMTDLANLKLNELRYEQGVGPRMIAAPGGGMFYEKELDGEWAYLPPEKVPAEAIPAGIIRGEELGDDPSLEGRLFMRQPDGTIKPYEEPGYEPGPTIDQQIADLLVQEGKMDSALKLWEFKNQMTPFQRQSLELQSREINQKGLEQALEISRSPADFFTLMQLQSGAAPIQQPGYTGAFRGIGPRGSQTITNLFERLGLIAPPAAPGVEVPTGPTEDELLRRQQAYEDRARLRGVTTYDPGASVDVGYTVTQAPRGKVTKVPVIPSIITDTGVVTTDLGQTRTTGTGPTAEEKVTFRGDEVDPFSTQRRQFTPPVILGPGDIPQPLAPSGVVDLGASVTPPGASVTPPGAPWVLGDVPQPYGLAPTDVGGGYQFTQAPMGSLGKKYAGGGIVRGPTLATLGETGPEMVVPLDPRKRAQAENLVNIYRRLTANDIPSFAEGGMVFNPKQAAQLGQSAKALTGGALAMKYGKGTGGWDPSGKVFKMSFGPAPTSVLQKYNLAPKVTSVSDKPITTAYTPGVTDLGGGTAMPWQQVEKMFQKAAPPAIPQAPGGSPTAPYATPATGTPPNIPKGVGAGLTPETFLKKQAPNIYKVGVLGQAIGAPKQLSPLAGITLPSMQAWRQFTPTERETFLAAVEATGIPRATFLREAGLTTFQPEGIPRGRTVRMQQQSLGGRTYT